MNQAGTKNDAFFVQVGKFVSRAVRCHFPDFFILSLTVFELNFFPFFSGKAITPHAKTNQQLVIVVTNKFYTALPHTRKHWLSLWELN